MRTLAVIPTRYEPERLRALLPDIETDVLLLDNGHEPPLPDAIDTRGLGIYAQWNLGWAIARERGYEAIAILNDDIHILPGTVSLLARALWSDKRIGVTYPDKYVPLGAGMPPRMRLDAVNDPGHHRTLTGFAFCARLSMIESSPFDEGFHWHYGDDAFDRRVRDLGYSVARVIGLPIEHESDSERDDWARRPELRKLVQQDLARWVALFERAA